MLSVAIKLFITYYILALLDNLFAWDATWRPLFCGFCTGIALGDVNAGLVMGASCEALFMGVSAIGGTTPADAFGGTMMATMFVIVNGASVELALAAATPVGILSNYLGTLTSPIGLLLLPAYEKHAEDGDVKGYEIFHWIYILVISPLPRAITTFLFGYTLGSIDIVALEATVPAWLLSGLDAAGGMMVAVGFGILASMIWSTDLAIYFFVGFALTEFLGLGTLQVTFFAVAVAWIMFAIDTKIDKAKAVAVADKQKDEELF